MIPRAVSHRSLHSLTLLVMGVAAHAAPPESAPPLPPPDPVLYEVIEVATAQELAEACWNLSSNQALVLAAGIYDLAGVDPFPNATDGRLTVGRYGQAAIHDIQIRGATGHPEDVVIHGAGMLDPSVPYGFQIFTAADVLLADLSISDVYYHAVAIENGQGATRVHLHHLRLFDTGQQIVKGNRGGGPGAEDVVIDYSELFYTQGAVAHPEGSPPGSCYTNGIDAIGGRSWIIRHNRFHRIACQNGDLAGPAVLMWMGSSDTLVDGNTFLDSSRGISLGLVSSADHSGGMVRNNMLRWSPAATYTVDVPIYTTSPESKILHNSVLTHGTYQPAGQSVAIEVRFAGATGVEVLHNLSDGLVLVRDGASPTVTDNLTSAEPSWFVAEATGDLALRSPSASQAIDRLDRLADAEIDYHLRPRPSTPSATDFGASEFVPELFSDGFENGDTHRWSSARP